MNKPRLIDANKLDREDLCDICSCAYCADCFSDENFEEWIKNQPTAYDIDNVVEALEKESWRNSCYSRTSALIDLDDAIEIVKGGGKHDD